MLRKVFSLSAGLDVFISAIGFSPYCRSGLWPRRGMVRETSIPVSILILPRAEIAGCAKRGNLLYAEFVVDGLGDGGGVVAHLGFAFGFDHDAGEGFGAGVADDYAAGILQVFFGGADGGGYGGNGFEGALFADLDVDDDLGEDFQVGGEFVDGFAGAGDEVEDDQRGKQAVAGGGQMGQEDMAGLLATEGGVVALHLLEDVAVAYGGA